MADDFPKTYLNHPDQWLFKDLLDRIFAEPDPDRITESVVSFLRARPLPMDDFPVLDNTYSRTMLGRHENGYEAMAARWQAGAVSSIHGHPCYALMVTVHGRLHVEHYEKSRGRLQMTSSRILAPGEFLSAKSPNTGFDNHIHGVKAIEETLSIHISSQDATKGEIFSRQAVLR